MSLCKNLYSKLCWHTAVRRWRKSRNLDLVVIQSLLSGRGVSQQPRVLLRTVFVYVCFAFVFLPFQGFTLDKALQDSFDRLSAVAVSLLHALKRWRLVLLCFWSSWKSTFAKVCKFVEAQESIKQIIPRIHRCRTLPWCMRQRYKLQRGARAFEPHRQRCCIERHLRSSSDLWPCALATSIWSLRLHWYDFIPRHLFWEDVALRNIGLISTRLHHLSGNVGTMWRPNASKYVNGALEAARSGASTNQRYAWCSFYSNSSIWERISGTITIMIRIIMYDAYSIYIYIC